MKNKPDDRRDNVDKIQYNITKTIQNCELADEMIAKTDAVSYTHLTLPTN